MGNWNERIAFDAEWLNVMVTARALSRKLVLYPYCGSVKLPFVGGVSWIPGPAEPVGGE